MAAITKFSGEYAFLSNFYPVTVYLGDLACPTVEHAYQAAKVSVDNPAIRAMIIAASTPGKAKLQGSRVRLPADWHKRKVAVMYGLLTQKFNYTPLRQQLLDTGQADLIELNTWGDKFWGCVVSKGLVVGENNLGRLLMQIRLEHSTVGKTN